MEELISRIQQRVDALPKGLRSHIYRVREIACELAQRHGIDEERAALGMLAHDVARATPDHELLRRAGELGLHIGTVERLEPLLLHGPVGAELLAKEDGLADSSLHQAVYWHNTLALRQPRTGGFSIDRLNVSSLDNEAASKWLRVSITMG